MQAAGQCILGVIILPNFNKAGCKHALKGLAPPRVSHYSEIAQAGAQVARVPRLQCASPFRAHAAVIVAKNK